MFIQSAASPYSQCFNRFIHLETYKLFMYWKQYLYFSPQGSLLRGQHLGMSAWFIVIRFLPLSSWNPSRVLSHKMNVNAILQMFLYHIFLIKAIPSSFWFEYGALYRFEENKRLNGHHVQLIPLIQRSHLKSLHNSKIDYICMFICKWAPYIIGL